jgi:hypothetical protein
MDGPRIISADTSLFDAITEIVKNQYVLIRDTNNKISGIVTTSDLSLEFRQLTEPFFLLAEVENHVRSLIKRGGFTTEQLRSCCDPNDRDRAINGMFDLTVLIRLTPKPTIGSGAVETRCRHARRGLAPRGSAISGFTTRAPAPVS